MKNKELEDAVLRDYHDVAGRIVLIGAIDGYVGEVEQVQLTLNPPVWGKILPCADRALHHEIVRWVDNINIDPIYDIAVMGTPPDLKDVRSTWLYGKSYSVDGTICVADFIIPSEDLLAAQLATGAWNSPPMHPFFVLLPGESPDTAVPGEGIVVVEAPELESVLQMLAGTTATALTPHGEDFPAPTYNLPGDANALQMHIKRVERNLAPPPDRPEP